MIEKIYYSYGFIYLFICLYELLKKPKELSLDFGLTDTEEAMKFAKNQTKGKLMSFLVTIIGFAWVIIGLFTDYYIIFGSILFMNIFVPLTFLKKMPEQIVKVSYLWHITESVLTCLILYLYFSPMLFQN